MSTPNLTLRGDMHPVNRLVQVSLAAAVLCVGPTVVVAPAQAQAPGQFLAETYPAVDVHPRAALTGRAASMEPFSGTMWISPNVLTPDDPTDLQSIEYIGVQERRTFDRRVNGWALVDSHVFKARYECALTTVDVVVNTELSEERARSEAQRFAEVHGRIPPGLRSAVHEIWIHGGDQPAGGGNGSVLVHVDFAVRHWPFVEELFLHEAAHTTLDYEGHGAGAVDRTSWESAKARDTRFISDYARDFPAREDVAESYVAFALWKVAEVANSSDRDAQIIAGTIPNRLAYLESLGEEFVPRTDACPVITPMPVADLQASTRGKLTTVSWTPPEPSYSVSHYEWRVGARVNALGEWRAYGDERSSSLVLRNQIRGKNWWIEVRAVWGSEPGPAMRIRFRS